MTGALDIVYDVECLQNSVVMESNCRDWFYKGYNFNLNPALSRRNMASVVITVLNNVTRTIDQRPISITRGGLPLSWPEVQSSMH